MCYENRKDRSLILIIFFTYSNKNCIIDHDKEGKKPLPEQIVVVQQLDLKWIAGQLNSEILSEFDEDVRRQRGFGGKRLGLDMMNHFEPFDRVHHRLLQSVHVVLEGKNEVESLHLHVDAPILTRKRYIET